MATKQCERGPFGQRLDVHGRCDACGERPREPGLSIPSCLCGMTSTTIPTDLRNLDNKPFNAESYSRWKKAHFDEGVAHGRKEATKEIRLAIAPALGNARGAADSKRPWNRAYPAVVALMDAIDSATKPTKRPAKQPDRETCPNCKRPFDFPLEHFHCGAPSCRAFVCKATKPTKRPGARKAR